MKHYDIIVIGAGASGMLAAGAAAAEGVRVVLLEKKERPGRKLLITGKGRCNITNNSYTSEFLKHIHPKGNFLKKAFSRFFTKDIISLLEENGVAVKTERGNRVFPADDSAASVVDGLARWIKKEGVDLKTNCRVTKLMASDNAVEGVEAVVDGKNEKLMAPKVIITTGGKAYPATGSTGDGYSLAKSVGHSVVTTRPALVPLELEGTFHQKLDGLLLKNILLVVWIDGKKHSDEFGELFFTETGISGPVILTQSRAIVDALDQGKKVRLTIDLKPALDHQKLDNRLLRDLDADGKKKLANIFKGWLPSALISPFIQKAGIEAEKSGHQVTAKERKQIRVTMKNLELEVSGYRPFKEAVITAGGVDTLEVEPATMESKLMKGLYFAGEVLDLDADTGGYNLQIAWSTGWVAGKSAAGK